VIRVRRDFKCVFGCNCCAGCSCCSMEIAVEAPVGQTIGHVKQQSVEPQRFSSLSSVTNHLLAAIFRAERFHLTDRQTDSLSDGWCSSSTKGSFSPDIGAARHGASRRRKSRYGAAVVAAFTWNQRLQLSQYQSYLGYRTVKFQGSQLWNRLPRDLMEIKSPALFKKSLKEYLVYSPM